MRWGMVLVLAFASCGQDAKPDARKAFQPASALSTEICKKNSDCRKGWVCLAGACADARSKSFVDNPNQTVTPDKVRRHAEEIAQEREKRAQKAFDVE